MTTLKLRRGGESNGLNPAGAAGAGGALPGGTGPGTTGCRESLAADRTAAVETAANPASRFALGGARRALVLAALLPLLLSGTTPTAASESDSAAGPRDVAGSQDEVSSDRSPTEWRVAHVAVALLPRRQNVAAEASKAPREPDPGDKPVTPQGPQVASTGPAGGGSEAAPKPPHGPLAAGTEDGGAAGGAAQRTVKPAGGAYRDEAEKNLNRRLEDAEASGSVLSADDADALLGKSAGGREASGRRKPTPVLPPAPRRAGLRLPSAVASRVRGTRYAP
jgi:hypothetical protein